MTHRWQLPLLCFLAACSTSPDVCDGMPEQLPVAWGAHPADLDTDALERELTERMADACIPAVSFAVVDRDGTVLEGAAGVVDVTSEEPVTVTTPFMVASASKAVTALALLMAEDDGLLHRDDTVQQHVGFEVTNHRIANGEPITLRHLTAHASGIQDNWDQVLDDSYVDGDAAEPLGSFLRNYLVPGGEHFHRRGNFHAWPAGREWMYSNVGAALAAHAVAEARSEPFDVLTERTVFEPLGMQHSHWFLADFDDIDTVARPHQIGPEGLSVGEHYGFPTWPDGQLRAPARDLAQLLRVPLGQGTVDGHRLLSPEASQALHTVAIDGLDDWYIRPYISEQYLLWFGMDLDGRWLVGHDGDDDGVTSEMFYEPATGRGVVVLANVADGELDGRVREVTAWLQHTLFDLEVP